MAVGDGYCTLVELKERVSIDDNVDDLQIISAIGASSRWIDEHCQRSFNQTTSQARVLDAEDYRTLCLGGFGDLVSVATLKTDDNLDGVFETTWAASDYQLLPIVAPTRPDPHPYTSIRSTGTRFFPLASCAGRLGLIEVTGVWGWPAVPDAVHEACLIQSARVFKRRGSPEGVTGWQSEFGPIRVSARADPDVEALLAPYRRTVVLVA
jgi:hypothetical protein